MVGESTVRIRGIDDGTARINMDLRRPVGDLITVSDASEYGGGACVAKALTASGMANLGKLGLAEGSAGRDEWALIECFAGIGGCRRAFELCNFEVAAHAVCEIKPEAVAVLMAAWPDSLQWGDVTGVTAEHVHQLMARGTRVKHVVFFVGSPCQGATAANVDAKGTRDPRTQLLVYALKIRVLVVSLYPNVQVHVLGENASSMVAHGRETLRWFDKQYGSTPLKTCSGDLVA